MDDIRFRDENNIVELAAFSSIGDREEQQDSFGHSLKENECLAVICDGMGGHKDGSLASAIAVEKIISSYTENYPCDDNDEVIKDALYDADLEINRRTDENGISVNSGTTVVAVFIKDNAMRWYSIGDSRAYLFRGEEVAQLTKDHTYRTVLEAQLSASVISKTKYDEEIGKGEKLINYLGIGNLSLIDYNNTPFSLHEGDIVLLVSDGIYKYLDGKDLSNIISDSDDIGDCLDIIVQTVNGNAASHKRKRDNMTAVMLRVK